MLRKRISDVKSRTREYPLSGNVSETPFFAVLFGSESTLLGTFKQCSTVPFILDGIYFEEDFLEEVLTDRLRQSQADWERWFRNGDFGTVDACFFFASIPSKR